MSHKMLVFQTDFGKKESSVAAMYGVAKGVDPEIELIEATHELPQFDIYAASYRLWQSIRYWPSGTIYVSVVDPGVGTDRKACAALLNNGSVVITPDNGTLTHVALHMGIQEVREIDETINMLHNGSSIFHGRDLFGYCAARLASGIITYEQVGWEYDPEDVVMLEVRKPVITKDECLGIIEIDDPNYGNLFTNIATDDLVGIGVHYGDLVHVQIQKDGTTVLDQNLKFLSSFGDAEKSELLVYNNEMRNVSFAARMDSFTKRTGIGYGPDWRVKFTKAE